jgi:hypothetical protein
MVSTSIGKLTMILLINEVVGELCTNIFIYMKMSKFGKTKRYMLKLRKNTMDLTTSYESTNWKWCT